MLFFKFYFIFNIFFNDIFFVNNKFNKYEKYELILEKLVCYFKNKCILCFNYIIVVLEDVLIVIFIVKMSCMKLL